MGVISQNGIDYPVPSVPVQSDGSATDLTNAAVPTGQTIKSYLNSNFGNVSQVTSTINITVSGGAIFAWKMGKLLLVSGYINPSSNVTANTIIATISQSNLCIVYDSPNSAGGHAARLKLNSNGSIQCESVLNANNWYSFSFMTFIDT